MISKFISFKNFHNNKASQKTKVNLKNILGKKSEILKSLSNNYKINGNIKKIKKKFKNYKNIRLIGMGGSILGSKAIYSFLKDNIKKNLFFIDNLNSVSSFDQKKNILI